MGRMRWTLRLLAAALVAAASLRAAAITTDIDYSDVWYNAPAESESGWGVNIAQQGEILFATMFVYGSDNTPRWLVSTMTPIAAGSTTFRGDLVSVGTGTFFGAPWTGIGNVQTVGTLTFTFNSVTTAAMAYTVNGTSVSKNILRQSWSSDVLSGTYVGAVRGFGPACGATGVRVPGTLTVTHTPPAIAMTLDFSVPPNSGRCSYQGTYSQTGSVGSISGGAYHCDVNGVSNAVTGSFTVDEIRATRNGWLGRLAVVSPQCNYNGYMGGVKDTQ